ncbi:hypothetical protein ACS0TY_019614 [Phlomoides rotata]
MRIVVRSAMLVLPKILPTLLKLLVLSAPSLCPRLPIGSLSGASAHLTPHAQAMDVVEPYNVLVVPHLTKNLLSISKLTPDYPVDILFTDRSFVIQNRMTKEPLARGRRSHGLYVLEQVNRLWLRLCTRPLRRPRLSFDTIY